MQRAAGTPLATVMGAAPQAQSAGAQPLVEAGWLPPTRAVPAGFEQDVWALTHPIPPRAGVAPGWPLPPQPPLARPRTAAVGDIDEP